MLEQRAALRACLLPKLWKYINSPTVQCNYFLLPPLTTRYSSWIFKPLDLKIHHDHQLPTTYSTTHLGSNKVIKLIIWRRRACRLMLWLVHETQVWGSVHTGLRKRQELAIIIGAAVVAGPREVCSGREAMPSSPPPQTNCCHLPQQHFR